MESERELNSLGFHICTEGDFSKNHIFESYKIKRARVRILKARALGNFLKAVGVEAAKPSREII